MLSDWFNILNISLAGFSVDNCCNEKLFFVGKLNDLLDFFDLGLWLILMLSNQNFFHNDFLFWNVFCQFNVFSDLFDGFLDWLRSFNRSENYELLFRDCSWSLWSRELFLWFFFTDLRFWNFFDCYDVVTVANFVMNDGNFLYNWFFLWWLILNNIFNGFLELSGLDLHWLTFFNFNNFSLNVFNDFFDSFITFSDFLDIISDHFSLSSDCDFCDSFSSLNRLKSTFFNHCVFISGRLFNDYSVWKTVRNKNKWGSNIVTKLLYIDWLWFESDIARMKISDNFPSSCLFEASFWF